MSFDRKVFSSSVLHSGRLRPRSWRGQIIGTRAWLTLSRKELEDHRFGSAGEGGLEEGVEGADDLEVLGAAGVAFGAAVDPVGPAAYDDGVEERAIRRLGDLERGAAGAGLGGWPPERPHLSLPCREAAAVHGRCAGRMMQGSPSEGATQWIW